MDVLISKLKFAHDDAGALLNPRGGVVDTSDLQASLRLLGQQTAVAVSDNGDGTYTVNDGHRRVVAAKALKWKKLRVEVAGPTPGVNDLRARMLAADVRELLKPSAKGRALQALIADTHWPLEKAALAAGITDIGRARDLIDVANAPEALRRRVDAGEMKLTAFRELIRKPVEVQEAAAALANPTVRNVRHLGKQRDAEANGGGMLDQLAVDNTVVTDLNRLRTRIFSEWAAMSESERTRATALLESIFGFIREGE